MGRSQMPSLPRRGSRNCAPRAAAYQPSIYTDVGPTSANVVNIGMKSASRQRHANFGPTSADVGISARKMAPRLQKSESRRRPGRDVPKSAQYRPDVGISACKRLIVGRSRGTVGISIAAWRHRYVVGMASASSQGADYVDTTSASTHTEWSDVALHAQGPCDREQNLSRFRPGG